MFFFFFTGTLFSADVTGCAQRTPSSVTVVVVISPFFRCAVMSIWRCEAEREGVYVPGR